MKKKNQSRKETGISVSREHILGPAQKVLDETMDYRGTAQWQHLHKHTPLLQSATCTSQVRQSL